MAVRGAFPLQTSANIVGMTNFAYMLVAVFVKGGRLYLLGFGLLWMRSLSAYGLRCPSCRRPLTGLPGQITVATGRCGNCGATIWGDETVRA